MPYAAPRVKREGRMAAFLQLYERGHTRQDACVGAGVAYNTLAWWMKEDPEFAALVRAEDSKRRNAKVQAGQIIVHRDRPTPPKGTFEYWRRRYMGRAVEAHQQPLVRALADHTNRRVIWLGPPGSGKDTTAGDWILYELCDDQVGLRCAWMMEADDFAKRRLARLSAYLTDEAVYQMQPLGGSSTVPEANLIEDYGPFRWQPGMVWADGGRVERPEWTQNKIYLLRVAAPEADPNLWTTGINGTMYGSRISLLVMSDAFTPENQKSPTTRLGMQEYIKGTLRSRFDGRGRFISLGTRTGPDSICNYQWMINYFVQNSRIIHRDGFYVKYANGTAVIIHPAILTDADGEEISYWESQFPLNDQIILPDGERIPTAQLTDDQLMEYAETPEISVIEGLASSRADDPGTFETLYQQNPPDTAGGEFTNELLDHCDDSERTIGVHRPGEDLILGVDPARSGGAAWVLWAVDREASTMTVVDVFYGEKLGINGITKNLIIDPISKYLPGDLAYETNHEYGVLYLPEVKQIIRDSAVRVHEHHTGLNRAQGEASVSSMAIYMRNGTIRFPAASVSDRQKITGLKQHFKNWDSSPGRTKSGQWKHSPDDMCMAAWIGFVYSLEKLQRQRQRFLRRLVPRITAQRWGQMPTSPAATTPARNGMNTDVLGVYFGDNHD